MSRIWTSFRAWVKDMHQAWSRHIVIVSVVAVAFGMLQKPLLALISFIESLCLAPLSPNWFGGFVFLLACYLLKRERDYRKIYVPRPVSLWLILLLGGYLYYRHWEGSFSFWPIPYFGRLAWSDLLLIPWGGAVAIALRSRSKEDRFFLGLVLLILCVVLYFVPQAQGKPSLVWALLSLSVAVGSCLLGYLILHRWNLRSQPKSKEEASKERALSSQAIDTDDAIEREEDDWSGFTEIARIVHMNLKSLDLRERSLTVGVIAPWGRGKSSFINLLRKRLERDGGIIIPFNPRGSKSVSSIPEDFFDAFAKALSRHYLGFDLLLARYTKHIGLLNQYEWTRPLGSLLTLLLPGKEQEAVNRTLRELGKRVYVLLDDLDRLSGEEILEVLKLIDRNASFSNTVFITAYDKAYVNNVLKKHLDHGLDHSFIDKYISWEIPLPEPDKEMLERLMKIEFPMKVKDGYPTVYEEIQRGWKEVGSTVIESLNSVRDLKRYLNLIIPRYNEMKGAVNPDECFLLYLLCNKDFGVYTALNSGRLLQLNVTDQTYVLAPNFEAELGPLSQWEGTKGILERLFSSKGKERCEDVICSSICNKWIFDTYFGYLESEDSIPYADVVSKIIRSQYDEEPHKAVDEMMEQLGGDLVVKAFLYLIQLPCRLDEYRSVTIELMAYIALKDNLPEARKYALQYELREFFSWDRFERYEELRIALCLESYKQMLSKMLSFVINTHPKWMSDLIDEIAPKEEGSSQTCVYSTEEISEILLKCQSVYYEQWKPNDEASAVRGFLYKGYMNGYPPYTKQALQALVSLIKKYPDGCVWVVLYRVCNRSTPSISWFEDPVNKPQSLDRDWLELSIDKALLESLEKEGFSLVAWLDLIKDPRIRYILNYIRSTPRKESFWRIELLPDEEADWDSTDYIYRAILAQEERERQQASSEG